MTGESMYGELKGGYNFHVPLKLADELIDADCHVLNTLANNIAFEIAVGANGVVWVNTKNQKDLCLIVEAINESEHIHISQIPYMVKAVSKKHTTNLDEKD